MSLSRQLSLSLERKFILTLNAPVLASIFRKYKMTYLGSYGLSFPSPASSPALSTTFNRSTHSPIHPGWQNPWSRDFVDYLICKQPAKYQLPPFLTSHERQRQESNSSPWSAGSLNWNGNRPLSSPFVSHAAQVDLPWVSLYPTLSITSPQLPASCSSPRSATKSSHLSIPRIRPGPQKRRQSEEDGCSKMTKKLCKDTDIVLNTPRPDPPPSVPSGRGSQTPSSDRGFSTIAGFPRMSSVDLEEPPVAPPGWISCRPIVQAPYPLMLPSPCFSTSSPNISSFGNGASTFPSWYLPYSNMPLSPSLHSGPSLPSNSERHAPSPMLPSSIMPASSPALPSGESPPPSPSLTSIARNPFGLNSSPSKSSSDIHTSVSTPELSKSASKLNTSQSLIQSNTIPSSPSPSQSSPLQNQPTRDLTLNVSSILGTIIKVNQNSSPTQYIPSASSQIPTKKSVIKSRKTKEKQQKVAKKIKSPATGTRKECHICSKTFASRSILDFHLLAKHNMGDKELSAIKCTFCSKVFTHPASLRTHLRIHTKECPWTCVVCDKKFGDNAAYRRHVRVHTQERPYSCEWCGTNFTQRCNLVRHQSRCSY